MILAITRYVVLGAFSLGVVIALLSWLVRTRRVSPFSDAGRGMRQLTDPVMQPLERLVVRRGGNPVQAGWWVGILVAVVRVITRALVQWGVTAWYAINDAAGQGPRALLGRLVDVVYYVFVVALFVRVIGGWIGFFRHTRWMRPAYWLTDWIVEPLRRILPPMGQLDFTPLVAWLLLMVLRAFVHSVLL